MAVDISKRIRKVFPKLSKSHKILANSVLNESEKIANITAAKFGQMHGISESTVVRFAMELGYDGYAEFQDAVNELLKNKLTLNERVEMTRQRIGRANVLDSVMESDITRIRSTMESIDRTAFSGAVDCIIKAKRIFVLAARSTLGLAYITHHNLCMLFDNVSLIQATSSEEVCEQLLSAGENDVVIAFSFPRYSTRIINGVKFARERKASVVVITDSEVSPLAEYASFLLTAESDMASFTDSLVAPLSIVNAIFTDIACKRQSFISERFNRLESIWNTYNVYDKR